MAVIDELCAAVAEGKMHEAEAKVTLGLEEGLAAETLLQEGLIAAMRRICWSYEEGEAFVPEMLVAARAMNAALALLKPRLVEQQVDWRGKLDDHFFHADRCDLGKALVTKTLRDAGFELPTPALGCCKDRYWLRDVFGQDAGR